MKKLSFKTMATIIGAQYARVIESARDALLKYDESQWNTKLNDDMSVYDLLWEVEYLIDDLMILNEEDDKDSVTEYLLGLSLIKLYNTIALFEDCGITLKVA